MAVKDFIENVQHGAGRKGVSTAGSIIKHVLSPALRFIAFPITSALLVTVDVWDYSLKKERILRQYSREIGAKLGKEPEAVTAGDMEEVAQENPTIKAALTRAKRSRNLDMVANVACSFLVFLLVAHVAIATIPAVVVAIGLGFFGFMAARYAFDKIGGKLLGISEPSLKKVKKNPELQEKLSVPSQVTYLEGLQNSRQNISSRQIITLFQKANSSISPDDAVMLADKLNEGLIDATSLAFRVYNQDPGVAERESRDPARKDLIIAELQERVKTLEERAREAGGVAKERAAVLAEAAKHRAGDVNDKAHDYWRKKHPRSSIAPDAIHQSQQDQVPPGVTFH